MSLLDFDSRSIRFHAFALAFLAATSVDSVQAQVARIEVHTLETQTLSIAEFLTGKKDGRRDTIAGELRIPRPGNDRLPAVILVHAVGGVLGNVDDWALHLNSMGVATFVLDSLTGRGLARAAGPGGISSEARIVDAYRALELLARHSRVDPDRIAIMGFSHGGYVALYSSLKRFARMHGPADGRRFAAHIVFYAGCQKTYLDGDDISDKPIRMFHGSADDSASVAPCREYVTRLRASGKDVVLTEYAGVHHDFDRRSLKEPEKRPENVSMRRCRFEEVADGKFLNSSTRQPASLGDPCIERGVTLAHDAQAYSDAVKAVTEFVAATLKPK